MRLRPLPFALLALALAMANRANAEPKKKKPKKPKTEHTREKDADDASSNGEPPKIDTNLREEDAPAPSTNPWVTSGESKKKGDEHGSSSSSAWDEGSERKKKPEDEWHSRPIALTAVAGYASANLRIGMGLRVGYSISDRFYIGGAFTYHLGTTFGDLTVGGYYPAAEIGYDYHVQGFTIRPYTGVGVFFLRVSGAAADLEVNEGNALAFYPGAQLDYQIGPGFVGVDARLLFVLGTDQETSLGFFAVGGVRF